MCFVLAWIVTVLRASSGGTVCRFVSNSIRAVGRTSVITISSVFSSTLGTGRRIGFSITNRSIGFSLSRWCNRTLAERSGYCFIIASILGLYGSKMDFFGRVSRFAEGASCNASALSIVLREHLTCLAIARLESFSISWRRRISAHILTFMMDLQV